MPISTIFDPQHSTGTSEPIVSEWLRDFFPASSHIVTFEPPAEPSKPTLWLQRMPSRHRDAVRSRHRSETVQREDIIYLVSVMATNKAESVRMSDVLRSAVLASASQLADAGLRYVEAGPFYDVLTDSQPQSFRRDGPFRFTIQVE